MSKAEARASGSLRILLADLPVGASIGDSEQLRDFLGSLEFFLPAVLQEIHPEWKSESLDGFLIHSAQKTGDQEAEFIGHCILITDQTTTPFHLRTQIASSTDEVSWLELKLGEMGRDGIVRRPYHYPPSLKRVEKLKDNQCEILPPSDARSEVLLDIQVTTRSPLGGIAYDTGGILIDHGWLRFPGSGHPRLARTLSDWNRGRSEGLYLVADDVVGGFFAINGGGLGTDVQRLYYWPPDRLEWEPMQIGFTEFFRWALTARLTQYYENLRWPNWTDEVRNLSGDQCFNFYPFLWSTEGSVEGSDRRPVPVAEAFDLKTDILRHLHEKA
jgi:hypothetical protein